MYLSYTLKEESREIILQTIPPKHNIVLHHVTLYYNPPEEIQGLLDYYGSDPVVKAIGIAQDEQCQALVCSVNGRTERPSGFEGIFHITYTLAEGIRPVYSNQLLKAGYFSSIAPLIVKGEVRIEE